MLRLRGFRRQDWIVPTGVALSGILLGATALVVIRMSAKPVLTSHIHLSTVTNPAVAGLSKDQVLDQLISPPEVLGFVKGKIVRIVATPSISLLGAGRATVFTDYAFQVTDFVGPGQAPYAIGSTINLRVPGGTSGKQRMTFEGAPRLAAGDTVFVLDRDQGQLGGGNTSAVLLASRGVDLFELRGQGTVIGQGEFEGFSEPLPVFLSHFQH